MSPTSNREPVAEVRARHTLGNRTVRCQILDEFVATTGHHRKDAIGLLNHPPPAWPANSRPRSATTDGNQVLPVQAL